MGNAVGTVKKVTLDGLTYDVMGDANFSQIKGKFTNEEVVTSGKNVQKKTTRAQKIESVVLQASADEAETLKELSERLNSFPMSYQTAAADVFRTTGFINFESHDTEAGSAAISLIPENVEGWALFGG